MKLTRIAPSEFRVSTWSGGTTTELYIDPAGADFKERRFDVRISSATFTGTASTFSDFTGYQRYLLPLVGQLSVEHSDQGKALYQRFLSTYDVEYFPGHWQTTSENSADCVDFNLIVRKGLEAHLQVFTDEGTYTPKKDGVLFLYSLKDFAFAPNALSADDARFAEAVEGGTLARIEAEPTLYSLRLLPDAPVILGEVTWGRDVVMQGREVTRGQDVTQGQEVTRGKHE
ncbi:MAG: HutD family protein [Peptoniphilaceae bacterium]|nr:HutD family protein [Peptoniphilaceae bacterium]MDY6085175.1 HutD family protein [Peptoniphilaceae bacterium]